MQFLLNLVPDVQVEEVDEGELEEGQEDGGEADYDKHVQGGPIRHLGFRLLPKSSNQIHVKKTWEG